MLSLRRFRLRERKREREWGGREGGRNQEEEGRLVLLLLSFS